MPPDVCREAPRGCAVEMSGITKTFPRVLANDRVDLKVKRGQVHALVGENGAGKTTLMNILYGLVKPDSGEIRVEGEFLPTGAGFLGLAYGIGMIHQHFMLVGRFTVLENIILGSEPRRGALVDRKAARTRIKRLMDTYGLKMDLDRRIDDLSVGEEQRVEILKVLYREARIIVMDEPTSVLTPQETKALFTTMRMLTEAGRAVVFITHKLEEVMEVAQTISVMRAGRLVATMPKQETDVARLAELMVGRRMEALKVRRAAISDVPVLEARNISLRSGKGQELLKDVSFAVHRGEILGISGVDGNGQTELFEVLVGLRWPTGGAIKLLGRDATRASTSRRLSRGMAWIPPDRGRMGLVGDLSLKENLILGRHRQRPLAGRVFLDGRAVGEDARELIKAFDIEPPAPGMKARLLSGGNQQKVVAARELARDPELLVASQPTRGLDVGAARRIHELLIRQAEAGRGVLVISADLAEVMSLADTIAVMYRGGIVGILAGREATVERLGLMMAGVAP